MTPNILGYHCNDKKRCERFIKEDYLIWSNSKIDGQWLGNGMYFWDNPSNAKYWKNEKYRKNKNGEFKIVVANINLEEFLDLTDEEVFCGVESYWNELNDRLKLTENPEEVYIGEKLYHLFQYVGIFKEKFNTIRIHAKYPRMTEVKIEYKMGYNASPRVTTKVRTIYSVKNKSAISNSCYFRETGY